MNVDLYEVFHEYDNAATDARRDLRLLKTPDLLQLMQIAELRKLRKDIAALNSTLADAFKNLGWTIANKDNEI